MFPEGWYNFDKPVGPLKKGIAKLARETGLKVVPLAIYGIKNTFIEENKLYWKDVTINSGEPVKYSDYENDKKFLTALTKKIETLYAEIEQSL